jgi:hypothetical protein
LQDADTILADCRDLVEQHGLDVEDNAPGDQGNAR